MELNSLQATVQDNMAAWLRGWGFNGATGPGILMQSLLTRDSRVDPCAQIDYQTLVLSPSGAARRVVIYDLAGRRVTETDV